MLVIKNLESNGDALEVKPVKWEDMKHVHNMQELEDLDPACDAARISASIGKRKKALMLEKASELGIKVLNK